MTSTEPMYVLQVWNEGRWNEQARDTDVWALRELANEMRLGIIGEDWKIGCTCGNEVAFYGCQARVHE